MDRGAGDLASPNALRSATIENQFSDPERRFAIAAEVTCEGQLLRTARSNHHDARKSAIQLAEFVADENPQLTLRGAENTYA